MFYEITNNLNYFTNTTQTFHSNDLRVQITYHWNFKFLASGLTIMFMLNFLCSWATTTLFLWMPLNSNYELDGKFFFPNQTYLKINIIDNVNITTISCISTIIENYFKLCSKRPTLRLPDNSEISFDMQVLCQLFHSLRQSWFWLKIFFLKLPLYFESEFSASNCLIVPIN